MPRRDDNLTYVEPFGWLDLDYHDGDLLAAIGIDVYDHDKAVLYQQRGTHGILKGHHYWIPKDREAIEAIRLCLNDAESRLNRA